MKLKDALIQVAEIAGLDANALIAYAAEDTVGGRDTGGKWSAMSVFESEGRFLYALTRALKPTLIVEIGVAGGGTTTHLLSALRANDHGHLWSVDIAADCGLQVPDGLRDRWMFNVADALTIELPSHADLVFEDGAHGLDFTRAILKRIKATAPHVIVSHDFYSHEVYGGFAVKQAWDEELPDGIGIKLDDAFTGLGYWVNPAWEVPEPATKEPAIVEEPVPPMLASAPIVHSSRPVPEKPRRGRKPGTGKRS
jgi:hypothetical protein